MLDYIHIYSINFNLLICNKNVKESSEQSMKKKYTTYYEHKLRSLNKNKDIPGGRGKSSESKPPVGVTVRRFAEVDPRGRLCLQTGVEIAGKHPADNRSSIQKLNGGGGGNSFVMLQIFHKASKVELKIT
jgi:hypothetical protein